MAITPSDFSKIWASNADTPEYTFNEADYLKGWDFVGNLPPTRAMWNAMQKRTDEKMKYVFDNFGAPLTASTVAGMTMQNRVYVYTGSETGYTAGHWYYYDAGTSTWVDGGVYNAVVVQTDTTLTQAGVPADAKVTGNGLRSIAYLQQNLFDKDTVVLNKLINTSGNEVADGQYSHSSAIPVEAGKYYTFKVYPSKFGGSANKIAFYDSTDTYVQGVGTVTDNIVVVQAPNNAVSMIVNVSMLDLDTFMVCKGTSLPDTYIPYNVALAKDNFKIQALGYDETNFIAEQSVKNLYNPNDPDILIGKRIVYSGTISDNSDLSVSGYIRVYRNRTYSLPVYTNHFGTGSNAKYVAGYNQSKVWVASIAGTLNGSILTFTVPNSTYIAYVRINVGRKNVNSNFVITPYHANSNFMMVAGSSLPTRYYPYTEQPLVDTNIYSAHENKNNPLYGKSIVFTGDSICEGGTSGGWAERIGTNNTMLWENDGIGGSSISTAQPTKVICTRTIKMTNPDYIIFEGGTNDADIIGNATGEVKPTAFGTWSADNYGTNDGTTYYGFDISTFCGAVDYMCKRLIVTYPGKKIGFIGAHKMGTTNTTRANRGYYIQTAMDICKKWGIPYLDLWNTCYLNPLIPALYTSGSDDGFYVDGQHLTAKGYDYITPIIESWLKTL